MYNISKADYEIVSILEDDHDSVKIVTGRYAGTIVTYDSVMLTEPTNGDESATLSFHYIVNDTNLDDEELESNEFKTYLGKLIEYILWSSIEEKNFKVGRINDSNDDSQESTGK